MNRNGSTSRPASRARLTIALLEGIVSATPSAARCLMNGASRRDRPPERLLPRRAGDHRQGRAGLRGRAGRPGEGRATSDRQGRRPVSSIVRFPELLHRSGRRGVDLRCARSALQERRRRHQRRCGPGIGCRPPRSKNSPAWKTSPSASRESSKTDAKVFGYELVLEGLHQHSVLAKEVSRERRALYRHGLRHVGGLRGPAEHAFVKFRYLHFDPSKHGRPERFKHLEQIFNLLLMKTGGDDVDDGARMDAHSRGPVRLVRRALLARRLPRGPRT